LGICLALELAAAAGAIGGVTLGAMYAIDQAGSYVQSREASAAALVEPAPARASAPAVPRVGKLAIAVRPAAAAPATVFDGPDNELLAPLAATPLASAKFNHGGTSLSMRLEFASGARAAFKPEQIHLQSNPRKEIAAYRIDRLLGIGHVPPAKPGAFKVDELLAAVEPAARQLAVQRLADEGIARGGVLHGELSWWIPEIRDLHFAGLPVDDPEGMDRWTAYLQIGAAIPIEVRPIIEQLATVIVFDVITDNADRWSGSNTKCSVDHKILYFMDNTLSFSVFTMGHASNLAPLHRIQVFPKRLIDRVRALTLAQINTALAVDNGEKLGPLLQPAEIRAILTRRDHLLQYVDDLVARFGAQKVLAL
jgi:hypothetical protein